MEGGGGFAGGEGEGLLAGLLPHNKTQLLQNLVRGLLVSVTLALDYCLMVR
jgi:hypothetical protein